MIDSIKTHLPSFTCHIHQASQTFSVLYLPSGFMIAHHYALFVGFSFLNHCLDNSWTFEHSIFVHTSQPTSTIFFYNQLPVSYYILSSISSLNTLYIFFTYLSNRKSIAYDSSPTSLTRKWHQIAHCFEPPPPSWSWSGGHWKPSCSQSLNQTAATQTVSDASGCALPFCVIEAYLALLRQ